jgi:hypothetical protein
MDKDSLFRCPSQASGQRFREYLLRGGKNDRESSQRGSSKIPFGPLEKSLGGFGFSFQRGDVFGYKRDPLVDDLQK